MHLPLCSHFVQELSLTFPTQLYTGAGGHGGQGEASQGGHLPLTVL